MHEKIKQKNQKQELIWNVQAVYNSNGLDLMNGNIVNSFHILLISRDIKYIIKYENKIIIFLKDCPMQTKKIRGSYFSTTNVKCKT